jgi:ADP-heptose:LPS heptosyltransferase
VANRVDLRPPIDRIVLVRSNNIGDFVCAVPAFRALRRRFPQAHITLVGSRIARPLAERIPGYVDRVLEFPGFPGIRERRFDPREITRFFVDRQGEQFDLAVQMHSNGVWSNPFTVLLGARQTVGFRRDEDSDYFLGLDASLVFEPDRHEVLRLLDLVGVLGASTDDSSLELPLRPEDHAEAARLLDGLATAPVLVGIHPGSKFPDREWPVERFATLACDLAASGATIVVTGSEADAPTTRHVVDAIESPRHVLDTTGRLSVPGLAALIARLDLLVTGDTGPAHLAYATATPSVTVFGSANPDIWGPMDRTRHRVVEADEACHPCRGEPCIRRIGVDRVRAEVELLLERRQRSLMARAG